MQHKITWLGKAEYIYAGLWKYVLISKFLIGNRFHVKLRTSVLKIASKAYG